MKNGWNTTITPRTEADGRKKTQQLNKNASQGTVGQFGPTEVLAIRGQIVLALRYIALGLIGAHAMLPLVPRQGNFQIGKIRPSLCVEALHRSRGMMLEFQESFSREQGVYLASRFACSATSFCHWFHDGFCESGCNHEASKNIFHELAVASASCVFQAGPNREDMTSAYKAHSMGEDRGAEDENEEDAARKR